MAAAVAGGAQLRVSPLGLSSLDSLRHSSCPPSRIHLPPPQQHATRRRLVCVTASASRTSRSSSSRDSSGTKVSTTNAPQKSLLRPLPQKAGRNSSGSITVRHQGGGHKRRYRVIDFRRKDKEGVAATVAGIEYDPNRTARIALLHYADGEKRYILAPRNLRAGDTVESGEAAAIRVGNCLPLSAIPIGTRVHAVELVPGNGAKIARSAGNGVDLVGKDGGMALLKLPSGEVRKVTLQCRATVGEVGRAERKLDVLGKAGRARWLGIRPTVRGCAMNPCDHPHGGGEGRTSQGRVPVNPWGKPARGVKTRKPHRHSDAVIVRRRTK